MLRLFRKKQSVLLNVLFTSILAGMMMGCSTQMPPSEEPIPLSLRQRCQPIQEIENTSGKATLKGTTTNADIFWLCSDKMDKLIEATEPKKK